jgi:subtilisin family serine protease
VENRAEVANISLGSLIELPALEDVIDWTEEHNLLIVAAIGNNGLQAVLCPASNSKAVCVSGVLPTDVKADFSNWNETADQSAPATGIESTWWDGTTGIWSGTSFSTPLVSASIANCLQRVAAKSPKTIRGLLKISGDNIDPLNPSYAGRLGPRLNFRKLDYNMRPNKR